VDDHRFDAHFAASALDTQRDFTTIGDKDFFKHGIGILVKSGASREQHSKPDRPAAGGEPHGMHTIAPDDSGAD
jgi:hypothetical protein